MLGIFIHFGNFTVLTLSQGLLCRVVLALSIYYFKEGQGGVPVSILKLQGVKIIISAFKTWILYTSGGSGNGVGGPWPLPSSVQKGEGGKCR